MNSPQKSALDEALREASSAFAAVMTARGFSEKDVAQLHQGPHTDKWALRMVLYDEQGQPVAYRDPEPAEVLARMAAHHGGSDMVFVPAAWRGAVEDLIQAVDSDCGSFEDRQDRYGELLDAIESSADGVNPDLTVRKDLRGKVDAAWYQIAIRVVDLAANDSSISDASGDVFGPIIDRLEAARGDDWIETFGALVEAIEADFETSEISQEVFGDLIDKLQEIDRTQAAANHQSAARPGR